MTLVKLHINKKACILQAFLIILFTVPLPTIRDADLR